MWIFTQYGFYSAVCARQGGGGHGEAVDRDRIMVRARVRSRLFVRKPAWADVVAAMVEETDYDNFKSQVARHRERADAAYESSLHEVWAVMHRLQKPSE